MPLVAYSELPAFTMLREEGIATIEFNNDLRCLNIGLLNLMPDAALEATERQWMRLCSCMEATATYVYPFTFNPNEHSAPTQDHVAHYYDAFSTIQNRSLDLLIVSGANPKTSDITSESFWQPMIDTIDWAREQGCPVVCSCLAMHAVAKAFYDIDRIRLPEKSWGVYPHSLIDADHAFVRNVDTGWYAPHSHVYGVTREQLEGVGIDVLVDSAEYGVYVAVSEKYPEFVFLQGHPEYDSNSLLKEFKREVIRFIDDTISEFPRLPENYFSDDAIQIITQFQNVLIQAKASGDDLPEFPEQQLEKTVNNLWTVTGQQLFRNLLCEVQRAQ